MDSHHLSARAVSGFSNSAHYDRHRPSYPADAVETLLDAVRVAGVPGATIIDLAAGTGKFTEVLVKRDEEYEILAVEPHQEMREELEKKNLKNVTVKDGLSTSIPAENESIDAVIAAQVCIYIHCVLSSFIPSVIISPLPQLLSPLVSRTIVAEYIRESAFIEQSGRWCRPSLKVSKSAGGCPGLLRLSCAHTTVRRFCYQPCVLFQ